VPKSEKKRLGDILIEAGKITEEQLLKGLKLQRTEGVALGKALEQLGFISQEEIILALSNQLGIPYVSLLEEASEKLMKVLDIDKLLEYIINIAKQGLNADLGKIFIIDRVKEKTWLKVLDSEQVIESDTAMVKGIEVCVAETGETLNIADAYADKRFDKTTDEETGYNTKNILSMPVKNPENEIIGVFYMANKLEGKFVGEDEEFLRSLANYTATAQELSMLHQELVEKKRMEHELSIAREIQVSLFPHTTPQITGYEIFGSNRSCLEVSGDYYDFFPLGDNKWLCAIGDVSGKGIPASLLMAVLQSHLKAINYSDNPIKEIIKLLNEYLVQNSIPDHYITFFLGILDIENHTFEYANAGHNPPFLLNRGKLVKELRIGGPIIGMFPGLSYTQEKIDLNKDDLVFCFTDGVTEFSNKKKTDFGEKRLSAFLKKNYHQTTGDIFKKLWETLNEFSQGAEPKDDITVLMVRRNE